MSVVKELNESKLSLLVSIPQNNVELVEAAIEGGADIVKIHINVVHHASKTHFGTFEEEFENIKAICKLCKEKNKLIGIVVGGNDQIPMEEVKKVIEEGFEFISLYDKHMNPQVLNESIYKMVAIDNEYKIEYVEAFNNLPIDILECSIMDPDTYGNPLTMREILQYQSVRSATTKPIVIPTQRNILPSQVAVLQEMGINGLMIGAIVTGKTKESIYEATKAFRKAIDTFNEER